MADEGRLGIATEAAPQALRPDIASGRKRLPLAWLAIIPFFAYAFLFLFLPAGSVLIGSFQDKGGSATLANVKLLFDSPYIDAYKTSIEISFVTALLGGLFGLLIAYAAIREGTPRFVRSTEAFPAWLARAVPRGPRTPQTLGEPIFRMAFRRA